MKYCAALALILSLAGTVQASGIQALRDLQSKFENKEIAALTPAGVVQDEGDGSPILPPRKTETVNPIPKINKTDGKEQTPQQIVEGSVKEWFKYGAMAGGGIGALVILGAVLKSKALLIGAAALGGAGLIVGVAVLIGLLIGYGKVAEKIFAPGNS